MSNLIIPKGRWSVLTNDLAKQCLDRRLGSLATFSEEVYAWTRERNRKKTTVSWQFTKNDARKKFNRFYHDIKN